MSAPVLRADAVDLVRDGRLLLDQVSLTGSCLSTGPVADVLTGDLVSKCFSHPIHLSRNNGRWTATAPPLPRI